MFNLFGLLFYRSNIPVAPELPLDLPIDPLYIAINSITLKPALGRYLPEKKNTDLSIPDITLSQILSTKSGLKHINVNYNDRTKVVYPPRSDVLRELLLRRKMIC